VLDEVVYFGDEVFDASKAASADCLLGNKSEPAFDLVEPGRIGWRVMDVEAGPLCEPESYLGMLVGGIVVDDQMNVEMLGHDLIDALEELQKLLVTMACLALSEDGPGRDIQGGKQSRGAMANVVMRHPLLHNPGPSATPAGCDLGLGSATSHRPRAQSRNRVIGRIQIKPHHIAYLLNKERIAGQLEALAAVRLDGERSEHSMYRGF